MRKLLLVSIAVISLVAGAFAAIGFQGTPALAAAAEYGAGAYTGSNPIGGDDGYVSPHGYSQATADYVVNTWAQFKSACGSATSGDVIWVPSGVTLTMASGDDHPTLKSGVVLASNRGQNGAAGGKLKNPYIVGGTGNYMSPIVYASSNCVISGLTFEGPGCFASTTDSRTNAAIRCVAGSRRVEVENCEISNFYQGGVYISGGAPTPWNSDTSTGRHWIHHCRIHGMQRHGFGYGVQLESGGSALIEGCDFYDCRHFICGGYTNSYEIRYCTIADSWYRSMGTGAPTGNTQLDAHGHGDTTAGYAGYYMWMHHNTLSANNTIYPPGKGNIGIRGIPRYECRVYNNWTKKTYKSGGPYTETVNNPGGLAYLAGPEGGSWGTDTNLAKHNMYVYDNWYGTTAPPLTPYSNHAPVLNAVGARSIAAGSTLSFNISAHDSDGDSLTFSASNLPSGATFSASSRTFSWTPDSSQAGTYSGVRFQVSDGSLTDYEEITITVTAVSTNIDPDINADGAVNSLDMIRVGQHWAETGARGWIREDINQDGSVSVLDAALVGQHWTG